MRRPSRSRAALAAKEEVAAGGDPTLLLRDLDLRHAVSGGAAALLGADERGGVDQRDRAGQRLPHLPGVVEPWATPQGMAARVVAKRAVVAVRAVRLTSGVVQAVAR